MFSLLKTDFFHQNNTHSYFCLCLTEQQLNTGVINFKHDHQNSVHVCFGFMMLHIQMRNIVWKWFPFSCFGKVYGFVPK